MLSLNKEEFDGKISDFEQALQKVAGDIASGAVSEKLLPPARDREQTVHELQVETEKRQLSLSNLKAEHD